MRYSFPHYRGKAEFVQPDPNKWKQIKKGMTAKEVVSLLGQPLCDFLSGRKPKIAKNCWYRYGHLSLPFTPHPRTYKYIVYFNEKGKVGFKEDPFGGIVSKDGIPTKPLIISPASQSVFTHYPRIVDVRWQPPAGQYPMKFEIEIGHAVPIGHPGSDGQYFDEIRERDIKSVYYCFSFVGSQPGRLRVRARNTRGIGPWSDHVNFDFTI